MCGASQDAFHQILAQIYKIISREQIEGSSNKGAIGGRSEVVKVVEDAPPAAGDAATKKKDGCC